MIEATDDDDYDELDPPSQPSPPPATEISGNHNLNETTSQHQASSMSPINQQEAPNIYETQRQESLNCDLCGFSTSSLDTMNFHKESNHPLISLMSIKEEKIRYLIHPFLLITFI